MSSRMRYAPSPTGLQHIGGIRTALFNYFAAKSSHGKFILRVEDTDQGRSTPEALDDLYASFKWLGIPFDESPLNEGDFGPYIQSERTALYRKYAQQLLDAQHVYPCFCTSERLDILREEQAQAKSKQQGYDRHCRSLDADEAQQRMKTEPYVLRFKVPLEGTTVVEDIILGTMNRKNKDINPDPVLLKSDGFPTYHLANVIDDHLMQITHVLRAQEWLPTAPLHILLYQSFGWEKPLFCHLPMVMGKDGSKLSKRHGSTSLHEFIEQGYLPEAIINYVSLLGWSLDGSTEFFTKEQLAEVFDITRINASPAIFDFVKLDWFNAHYIQQCDVPRLEALLIPYLEKTNVVSQPITESERSTLHNAMPLIQPRLKHLSSISSMVKFLYHDVQLEDASLLIPKKASVEDVVKGLEAASALITADFLQQNDEDAEAQLKEIAQKLDLKVSQVLLPIRIACTGTKESPTLVPSLKLMGWQRVKIALERALSLLNSVQQEG